VLASQRLRQRHQAAATQALHSARDDQQQQCRCEGASDRGHGKNSERAEQHAPAAEAVTEMSIQRRRNRGCKQVRNDHPGDIGKASQRARDRRQGAGEDRLIGGREEHRDHHPREHAQKCLAGRHRRLASDVALRFRNACYCHR
jgi:hypothetical protein